MAFGARDDQTEPASPKRRQEARERGQVAKSRELAGALSLLTAIVALWFLGLSIWESLAGEMKHSLQEITRVDLQIADIQPLMGGALLRHLSLILPILAVSLAVGVLVNVVQVGVLFTADPLLPRWSRLNPGAGIKRFFSLQASVELGKAVLKLVIVGSILVSTLRSDVATLLSLGEQGVAGFLGALAGLAAALVWKSGLALLVLAGFDYCFQRWEYEQSLKMSKTEVKEETRQQEVDPKIKARIRSMQREVARQQMMAAVPKATVVITNPTHVAVAVTYERGIMPAPQVVARGAGYLAERIKTLAKEAAVPIVEDRPLAQMLYRHVEVGEFIPVTLYKAVAEVLAYVYSVQGRGSKGAP